MREGSEREKERARKGERRGMKGRISREEESERERKMEKEEKKGRV